MDMDMGMDMETISKLLEISLEVWNAQAALVPAEKKEALFDMLRQGKSYAEIRDTLEIPPVIVARILIEKVAELNKDKRRKSDESKLVELAPEDRD